MTVAALRAVAPAAVPTHLGVLGGIVAWRDRRPAARVALRGLCLRGARASRVTFTRARAVARRDRVRPFTGVVRSARRVGAHALLRGGRVLRVARRGSR